MAEKMIPKGGGTTSMIKRMLLHLTWFGFVWMVLIFRVQPSWGESSPRNTTLPIVIMVEFDEIDPNDEALYSAVKAQLSAWPLQLKRAVISRETWSDESESASLVAASHGASLVFWIADSNTSVVSFYHRDNGEGQISRRALETGEGSTESRHEMVAIATASMVEGLLVSPRPKKKAEQNAPRKRVTAPVPVPVAEARRVWLEIGAGYTAALFADEMVTHGGRLGLSLLPVRHVVISASFTLNFPMSFENNEVELLIASRQIEFAFEGRIPVRSLDIRLGGAWLVDFRSFNVTTLSDSLEHKPDGFKAVHSITPFVCLVWHCLERMGLFIRVGASLSLNDTDYQVERSDGPTDAVTPFVAKPTGQLGVIVKL